MAVAVNSLVLPDTGELTRALRSIARLVRPGGHFLGIVPAIDAVPPSGINVSARMRPAIGPATLICFWPASLVAAIFQPKRFAAE